MLMTASRLKLLSNWRWISGALATVFVGLLTLLPCPEASSLKRDEEVILFNTSAGRNSEDNTWDIPIHGWIFEREADSVWRKAGVEGLLEILESDSQVTHQELFRKRAQLFLVDNERGKNLQIALADQVFDMNPSAANGHFSGICRVNVASLENASYNSWIPGSVVMPEGDQRLFKGKTQLLARQGLSIISDIDDTIKISNVLDKHDLLANTFLREFRPVPGMARLYQKWASEGASFHYLSSSPWQLYPSLSEFIDRQGFPTGSFHLNNFRVKDKSFFNLFQSALEAKPPRIEAVLNRYRQRSFILIGDSGEKDPEVYGIIARRYPQQIKHIFIRNVQPGREQHARFSQAFKRLPRNHWTVFEDAGEIIFRND